MSRRKNFFTESAFRNKVSYTLYIDRLTELALSRFQWNNLPDSVDKRYIELELFKNGCVVYFNDEVMGNLCLDCITQGRLNVYGEPLTRRAYSRYNNYQKILSMSDSVIIWNNMLRTNSVGVVESYAWRLYNIDRVIDVNVNGQKTPVLVQGTEKQKLSLVNLYKEYDGNSPVIFGDSNLDINSLKSINTGAPYVADKLYDLRSQIFNECLTLLGISNVNVVKKERLNTDEVTQNQGGVIASRLSPLTCRQEAAEKINKMFGTNITVDYSDNVEKLIDDFNIEEGGENDGEIYD